MQIIRTIEDFPSTSTPLALAIGNFDGVHLGHQSIFNALKANGASHVITFSNHPVEVLHKTQVTYLMTLDHRLRLLEECGIERTILIPFTEAFSKLSPDAFLTHLRKYIPFSHLVLGADASIGHQRSGTMKVLQSLARKLGFTVEYLKPIQIDGVNVSSSQIRRFMQEGNLEKASCFLGRPFSIISTAQKGAGKGKTIGFPTVNLSVEGLCLPPLGVYAVEITYQGKTCFGIANLGIAPTLQEGRSPVLEVHFFDYPGTPLQKMQVTFLRFLRPEKKFDSVEALIKQIQTDIVCAKKITYNELNFT